MSPNRIVGEATPIEFASQGQPLTVIGDNNVIHNHITITVAPTASQKPSSFVTRVLSLIDGAKAIWFAIFPHNV